MESAPPKINLAPPNLEGWRRHWLRTSMEFRVILNKSQIGYLLIQLDSCLNILATTNTIPSCSGFPMTHNESLHRMLTRKVPKTRKVSYETYRQGAELAVIQYNDGVTALANILKRLGIDPQKRILDLFKELDNNRLYQANTALSQSQQKSAKCSWKI